MAYAKEIWALVVASYDDYIHDKGEPITSRNMDERATKLVIFNAADFIGALKPPSLSSLAGLSKCSHVQGKEDGYGC
eukprot:14467268-Ditylum_brightwellii.AAC.1